MSHQVSAQRAYGSLPTSSADIRDELLRLPRLFQLPLTYLIGKPHTGQRGPNLRSPRRPGFDRNRTRHRRGRPGLRCRVDATGDSRQLGEDPTRHAQPAHDDLSPVFPPEAGFTAEVIPVPHRVHADFGRSAQSARLRLPGPSATSFRPCVPPMTKRPVSLWRPAPTEMRPRPRVSRFYARFVSLRRAMITIGEELCG